MYFIIFGVGKNHLMIANRIGQYTLYFTLIYMLNTIMLPML